MFLYISNRLPFSHLQVLISMRRYVFILIIFIFSSCAIVCPNPRKQYKSKRATKHQIKRIYENMIYVPPLELPIQKDTIKKPEVPIKPKFK